MIAKIRSHITKLLRDAVLLRAELPEVLEITPFQDRSPRDYGDLDQDGRYVLFEDAFRGAPSEIAVRQSRYLPWIREGVSASGGLPVLDAGFGRGEFLRALRDEGIVVRGVDLNASSCASLIDEGFDVTCRDVNAYLKDCQEAEYSAVVSNSVIEHMEPDDALEFLRLATRAVAPGGCVVVETNNPECAFALGQFWLDPTHTRPYHALTVTFHLRSCGCSRATVTYACPVSRAHRVPGTHPCNYQEYAAVGFKEGVG
ncbi:MAG: class I SAM-dependent methyltransferase [Coriobacteriia bacterium]|nr:class I SAM-dependent methyltransferase [Coriobacteriia bacterium]